MGSCLRESSWTQKFVFHENKRKSIQATFFSFGKSEQGEVGSRWPSLAELQHLIFCPFDWGVLRQWNIASLWVLTLRTRCFRILSPYFFLSFFFQLFLDASSHLYKRVCPSVRPSVGPSVRRSVRRSVRHAFVKNAQNWGFYVQKWSWRHTKSWITSK